MNSTQPENNVSVGRCPQEEDGNNGTGARSAVREQGAHSINIMNAPLGVGQTQTRPTPPHERGIGTPPPQPNLSARENPRGDNQPAGGPEEQHNEYHDPPPRDEGEAGLDEWGDNDISDNEIDEDTLRAEWQADDEANPKKKTKASVLVASCNMKGRGETDHMDRPSANNKWMHVNQILREKKIGILALQETHMTNELDAKIATLFGKRIAAFHSKDEDAPNTKGVSIVVNKDILDTEGITTTEIVAGRALVAHIPWHNHERLTILAVYAPNRPDANRDFWNTLLEKWDEIRLPRPDLMLGDFNFVEAFVDRLPAHDDRADIVQAFGRLKTRLKLADGWRTLNPGARNYTYMQAQSEGRPQSRIDRIYASSKTLQNSQEWDISPTGGILTDHWMATVRILSEGTPFQGPGRWSLPLYLLRDTKTKNEIKRLALELEKEIDRCTYRRTPERNPQSLFKTFKSELATFGRQRAKETTPALKREVEELTTQRKKLANDPRLTPAEKKDATIAITERINAQEEKRHTLARISTAARDTLEGERITKYWSATNAPARRNTPIRNLRRPDGRGLEARSDRMAEIARNHHESVQNDGPDIAPDDRERDIVYAHSKIQNKLTNIQKAAMAKRIRENEVEAAIQAAPPGKAAGLDGLPAEIWKELAHDYNKAERCDPQPSPMPPNIRKILTKVYNDVEEYGIEEGTDFNEGWMCPIFKKSERSEIANYRPITVLNTDYKIMTKAITIRLTDVIGDIINRDQAGFIPKRSIFDQVKLAKLVLKHAEEAEVNGAIVALDQEKAYDKIAHDYLWRTLIEFNMPQNFVNTVIRLYTNAHTSVMINGVLSSAFKITRGVRQGDPLSCLLFNMAIEPLACAIRQSNLNGIKIPGLPENLIVKLFADDTTVYLDSKDDLNTLHEILDRWCRASRAKFNISKTEVIPIGMPGYRNWVKGEKRLHGTHDETRESMRFSRDGEPTRLLGAWIGNNIDNAVPWAPVVEKIERALERWDRNHPSIEGRRLIIQMVVGGTTQYLTKVQEMPDNITKRLTDILWSFIWDGNQRNAPVNRETMHAHLLSGGKKILDLSARNEAIQLTWLQTYLKEEDRPTWAFFADDLFRRAAPQYGRRIDANAAENPFLQSWRPKTNQGSPLPGELKSMIKIAEKHGTKLDGIEIGDDLKQKMPIWFHIAESQYMRQMTNRNTARCLRTAHQIIKVGQLENNNISIHDHVERRTCTCRTCNDQRAAGCRNPTMCKELGRKLIASMPEQWRPGTQTDDLDIELSEADRTNNETALTKGGDVTFERILTVNSVTDAVRVFAPKEPRQYNKPVKVTPNTSQQHTNTAWTTSQCKPIAENATRTVAAVWFAENDDRNVAFTVGGKGISKQRGEIMAISEALRLAPTDQPLRVICQNRHTVENLTSKLRKLEDKGWIDTRNGDIFRIAAAWAKRRSAKTYFKIEKIATHGKPESGIYDSMKKCLEDNSQPMAEPARNDEYDVAGAKLSELSQADLYKHIVEGKRKQTNRRLTEENIDRIKSDILVATKTTPETELIWKSVRNRDFSRAQRTFKWRAVHGSYKVGSYWRTIPNYEDRANCPVCGEEESIEHILLTCTSPTRRAIKEAEADLWKSRTNIAQPQDNLGTRLGAGLIHLGPKRGLKEYQGIERFWRIIQSETDQVLWTLRCEARIARGDRMVERHTIPEALNRWRAALERRMNIERIATDGKRFGPIAMERDLVIETWGKAIKTAEDGNADQDWIDRGGVLVGRRPRRPGEGG
jgi:exonuclease III